MRKTQAQGLELKVQDGGARIAHFPRRLKNALGFTLIEVLIAMTLLSIMVVLLFSSLRICAQSWEQGENKITEVNEVAVVYNFFQRHLSLAMPLWNDFTDKGGINTVNQPGIGAAIPMDGANAAGQSENGAAMEKSFSFQGSKQSLQFVSVFPASAGRSGMQLFSVQPQEQDGEQTIKVSITPFFPVADGEQWHQEEVVLLKHVSDFSLSYFGVAEGASESSWQDEWLKRDAQPRLVKINIGTTNGVFWPEMIVELKISSAGINNPELGPNSGNDNEPPGERN